MRGGGLRVMSRGQFLVTKLICESLPKMLNVWRFSELRTLNSCNSCIYRYINLKLAENFQNVVIYIV